MIQKSTKQFKKIVVAPKLEKRAEPATIAPPGVSSDPVTPTVIDELLGRIPAPTFPVEIFGKPIPPMTSALKIPAAQPFVVPTTKPAAPTCNIAKLTYYNHGTRPGTYKQWSIWVKDNVVTTEWGPYLGTLQQTSKSYKFAWQASECYNKILSAKIKKGYMKTIMDLSEY